MEGSIRQTGDPILSLRRILTTLTLTALFLTAHGFIATGSAQAQGTDPGEDFVDGEVVAKLDLAALGVRESCRPAIQEAIDSTGTGASIREALLENRSVACIYLLELPEGPNTDTEEAARDIAAHQRIAYAEPNFTTEAPEGNPRARSFGVGDPEPSSDLRPYRDQYAISALKLEPAHKVNKGAGSTVAVLDTGVQAAHPELADSLTTARYDFVDDDNVPQDEGNENDDDGDTYIDEMLGHGTHVAGIVHLTAPEAKIMPLRVLDSDGIGNTFLIAEAIQYAVDPDGDPKTDDGVDVINMSLGTSRESNLIRDVSDDLEADEVDDDDGDDGGDDGGETGPALEGVPTKGVVVVGSVGNENSEEKRYPAAEEGVIGVASVDEGETKSEFSNYGSPQVDVAAPGDKIYSTFPNSQYASWEGTSMAAPFVSGQAALIRSMRPGLPSTATQQSQQSNVTDIITTTARSLDQQNPNYSGKLGAGHADVYRSALKANTAPVVSLMRPVPGSKIRDRSPLLSATVRDAQTNLTKSNLKLYLDGREIGISSYNTSTDRMSRAVRLSPGSHTVRVTARDAQGLSATQTWRFRIV